jgi:hypothetical protein
MQCGREDTGGKGQEGGLRSEGVHRVCGRGCHRGVQEPAGPTGSVGKLLSENTHRACTGPSAVSESSPGVLLCASSETPAPVASDQGRRD